MVQLFLGETCYVDLGTLQLVLTCQLTYRSLTLRYVSLRFQTTNSERLYLRFRAKFSENRRCISELSARSRAPPSQPAKERPLSQLGCI